MKVAGLHHVAIKARDVEVVTAFYRDVLGLVETKRHHEPDGQLRSVWLEVGGAILMIERSTTPEVRPVEAFSRDVPQIFLLAFRIDAAARGEVKVALTRRGIAVEGETAFTLYVRDPEGNRVGLSSYPDAGA